MIEHDYLRIYRVLCDCWWDLARRAGQCGLHRHDQDSSYDFFPPDTPSVDVVSSSQSSRAKGMTWLEAVEAADTELVEAAELFAQTLKFQNVGRDMEMEMEMASIVQELGLSRARDHIGRIICGGCSRASDHNLPEYRWRRRKLLGRKVRNGKSSQLQM